MLLDVAQRVQAGQPIDLAMGYLNTIWLTDANAIALQTLGLASSPPMVLNVTGPELLSVRKICEEFGECLGRPVAFQGTESQTALLSNSQKAVQLFGPPRVSAGQMIRWTADWLNRGLPTLNKPTHFESRDGKF